MRGLEDVAVLPGMGCAVAPGSPRRRGVGDGAAGGRSRAAEAQSAAAGRALARPREGSGRTGSGWNLEGIFFS